MEAASDEFLLLKERIERAGLLKSSPWFYAGQAAITLTLLSVSAAVLAFVESFWEQMVNAELLGFTFGQLGFLMHDVGHNQVVGIRWLRPTGMLFNVLVGWSTMWWVEKHTPHHRAPNQKGRDHDIDIRFLAFTPDQAREKKGLYRVIARYQHLLFPILLLGELWHLRCAAVRYLLEKNTGRARVDLSLMATHMVAYLGVLLFSLPPWHALAFVAVHTGLSGVYLGMVFATNHIGMPIVEPGAIRGYLRQQIVTAREIRGGWFITFLFGGLNHQIVHHLFPGMSRSRLHKAAIIVEQFCLEKDILYCSVSPWRGYKQVFAHLRLMGSYAN